MQMDECMDGTSPITITLKPELNKAKWALKTFKPGEVLRLTVLELKGDRALIDFGKFRATADIKIPVMLGENLLVKVLESDKQLRMGVIRHGGENPSSKIHAAHEVNTVNDDHLKKIQAQSRHLSAQTIQNQTDKNRSNTFIHILDTLNSYFESFDLKKNIAKLIPQLVSYIENSGLFSEKRLESELFQLFTFALPLKEDAHVARLKVYYQKKRPGESHNGYRISLLLALDRLGEVRTDFFLLDTKLTISFYVKENSAKREIERHYHSLKEALNHFFDPIFVNVVVSENKILDFDREDMRVATDKRVDLRV